MHHNRRPRSSTDSCLWLSGSKGKRIIADVAEQLDRQRKLGKNGVACLLEECGLQPSDFILLEAKTLLAFDKGSQPLIEKALDSALGAGTIRGNGLNNPVRRRG